MRFSSSAFYHPNALNLLPPPRLQISYKNNIYCFYNLPKNRRIIWLHALQWSPFAYFNHAFIRGRMVHTIINAYYFAATKISWMTWCAVSLLLCVCQTPRTRPKKTPLIAINSLPLCFLCFIFLQLWLFFHSTCFCKHILRNLSSKISKSYRFVGTNLAWQYIAEWWSSLTLFWHFSK